MDIVRRSVWFGIVGTYRGPRIQPMDATSDSHPSMPSARSSPNSESVAIEVLQCFSSTQTKRTDRFTTPCRNVFRRPHLQFRSRNSVSSGRTTRPNRLGATVDSLSTLRPDRLGGWGSRCGEGTNCSHRTPLGGPLAPFPVVKIPCSQQNAVRSDAAPDVAGRPGSVEAMRGRRAVVSSARIEWPEEVSSMRRYVDLAPSETPSFSRMCQYVSLSRAF